MQIERVDISSLVLDPVNARKHNNKNLDAIKGSLSKWGQRKPIVVRGNVVIAGNGTLSAARALGWVQIAVVRADDLNATDATAYAIADNRTAELAEWDDDLLSVQLQNLKAVDVDLDAIGFDSTDLKDLLKVDDSVPGAPGTAPSQAKCHTCPSCGVQFTDVG